MTHTSSIFHPADYQAVRDRIASLTSDRTPKWGRMTPAQMLAHCCVPLEQGLGKIQLPAEGSALKRWLIKQFVLRARRFRPNLPTSRFFVVRDERDFETEKARLLALLDEAHRRGAAGPWAAHNLFGTIEPEAWGRLSFVHLNHHLEQFAL